MPAVSTDYRALSRCCRHAASATFSRRRCRNESRLANYDRAVDGFRVTADPTLARLPRAQLADTLARFLEGFSAPVWYGSRTRNSQIMGLVLYPLS